MNLYNKAVEFIKMKKHMLGENFYRLGMKVTIILSSDGKLFTACSTYDDLSEYNAFVLMKMEGCSSIKRIICVDEYECVFLPDMKFIEYIINDCEDNSNAFVFADPSHIISVFSIIQINKRELNEKNEVKKNNQKGTGNNIIYGNNVPSADSSRIDFNSEFEDFSDESRKPVVVIDRKKSESCSEIHTGSADSFEETSAEVQKPVVVMKKQPDKDDNSQSEMENSGVKSVFSAIKSKHISKINKKKDYYDNV